MAGRNDKGKSTLEPKAGRLRLSKNQDNHCTADNNKAQMRAPTDTDLKNCTKNSPA